MTSAEGVNVEEGKDFITLKKLRKGNYVSQ